MKIKRKHLLLVMFLLAAAALTLLKIPVASSQGVTLVSGWVEGDLPVEDASAAAWQSATALEVPLSAQNVAKPFLLESKIKSVTVRALQNATQVAFLVEWADATEDDSTVAIQDFRDAAALQFPLAQGQPFFCMGQQGGNVNLWHWKADWQAEIAARKEMEAQYPDMYVDYYPYAEAAQGKLASVAEYTDQNYLPAVAAGNLLAATTLESPVEDLVAGGFGTLTAEAAEGQNVQGFGTWQDGKWQVIFSRSLDSSGGGGRRLRAGEDVQRGVRGVGRGERGAQRAKIDLAMGEPAIERSAGGARCHSAGRGAGANAGKQSHAQPASDPVQRAGAGGHRPGLHRHPVAGMKTSLPPLFKWLAIAAVVEWLLARTLARAVIFMPKTAVMVAGYEGLGRGWAGGGEPGKPAGARRAGLDGLGGPENARRHGAGGNLRRAAADECGGLVHPNGGGLGLVFQALMCVGIGLLVWQAYRLHFRIASRVAITVVGLALLLGRLYQSLDAIYAALDLPGPPAASGLLFNLGELLVLASVAALWWAFGRGASWKTWLAGLIPAALFLLPRLLAPATDGDYDDLVDGVYAVPALAGVRDGDLAGERDGDPVAAAGRGGGLGGAAAGGGRLRGADDGCW